jgi:membrane-bound ClpP family serine protease
MTYLFLALILFAFGAVLLIGEYFFATQGILLVAGILCFFGAVGVIGVYGTWIELVVASIVVVLAVPLSTYGAITAWRKVYGGDPSPSAEASIAEMPELAELNSLKGRFGKTISALRPSGVVEFEDRKIDAISEGLMIEKGSWVKCVDVKPGRVIVRLVTEETQSSPTPSSTRTEEVVPQQNAQSQAPQEKSIPVQVQAPKPIIVAAEESAGKAIPEKKKLDLNNDDWQIN